MLIVNTYPINRKPPYGIDQEEASILDEFFVNTIVFHSIRIWSFQIKSFATELALNEGSKAGHGLECHNKRCQQFVDKHGDLRQEMKLRLLHVLEFDKYVTRDKSLKCLYSTCPKLYTSKSTLLNHMLSHSADDLASKMRQLSL